MIVNLIPLPRILARRRTTLIRRWTWAGSLYAAGLVAGYGAAVAAWDYDRGALQDHLESETRANADRRSNQKSLEARLARERTVLAANRAVGDQPNWALLLSLISAGSERQIVLQSCHVEPAPESGETATTRIDAKPSDREAVCYTVKLRAIAKDQAAVSAFALRLESSGLFTRVELVESRREVFLDADAVRFRLDCRLQPAEAAP